MQEGRQLAETWNRKFPTSKGTEKLPSVINKFQKSHRGGCTSWSLVKLLLESFKKEGMGDQTWEEQTDLEARSKRRSQGTVTARTHAWKDTGCFQNRDASMRGGGHRRSSCEGKRPTPAWLGCQMGLK